MSHPITAFIEHHAGLFREGRFEEMLDHCSYPLGVQGEDGLEVLRDREAYRAWLQRWKGALGGRRMRDSTLRIHTLELPRAGRFRVWIQRGFEGDGPGQRLDLTVIYYCRFEEPRMLIEMIEFASDAPGALMPDPAGP